MGSIQRVVVALTAALLVTGCSQPPMTQTAQSDSQTVAAPSVATEIATGVSLSLEIASDTLAAGTESMAIVTISNESTATVDLSDFGPHLWIIDSSGTIILEPRIYRHPIPFVPLEPGQRRSSEETFTVPPAGDYSIQAGWTVSGVELIDDGRTRPLEFTSVTR